MEVSRWSSGRSPVFSGEGKRVYCGCESDPERAVECPDIVERARRLRDRGRSLTLVTPYLTEAALERVCAAVTELAEVQDELEVVCNDWGLVHWLGERRLAEPVIGRLLVGQAVDARLAALDMPDWQLPHERPVQHADGSLVQLRYRRPSEELNEHLRSLAIDTPEVLAFLRRLGVRRIEISNALQGLEMQLDAGWRVTLHMPDVPVAIARRPWRDRGRQWRHPTFPVTLHHRDNMVYYRNPVLPPEEVLDRVDRVVYYRG